MHVQSLLLPALCKTRKKEYWSAEGRWSFLSRWELNIGTNLHDLLDTRCLYNFDVGSRVTGTGERGADLCSDAGVWRQLRGRTLAGPLLIRNARND